MGLRFHHHAHRLSQQTIIFAALLASVSAASVSAASDTQTSTELTKIHMIIDQCQIQYGRLKALVDKGELAAVSAVGLLVERACSKASDAMLKYSPPEKLSTAPDLIDLADDIDNLVSPQATAGQAAGFYGEGHRNADLKVLYEQMDYADRAAIRIKQRFQRLGGKL